jgi:hypothetical protein
MADEYRIYNKIRKKNEHFPKFSFFFIFHIQSSSYSITDFMALKNMQKRLKSLKKIVLIARTIKPF